MGNFIKQFFDIKFWKFILVGILNTVVGMGLQFLFFNLCGWNEWVSSLIGYILGSILSYFLNKYFTFKNKDKGWKPIVKFALNIAICYLLILYGTVHLCRTCYDYGYRFFAEKQMVPDTQDVESTEAQ